MRRQERVVKKRSSSRRTAAIRSKSPRLQSSNHTRTSGITDRFDPSVIVDAIRRFFALHGIERRPVVVATSGGVDSTALLLAIVEMGDVEFTAAHVNHHLRGADSDDDEAYVRELCARYD